MNFSSSACFSVLRQMPDTVFFMEVNLQISNTDSSSWIVISKIEDKIPDEKQQKSAKK